MVKTMQWAAKWRSVVNGRYGSRSIFLLCGGIAMALVAGCSHVPSISYQTIELRSCVDGALTVQFDLVYSNAFVSNVSVDYTSNNVVGTPLINPLGSNSFRVTAELTGIPTGDPVTIGFAAQVGQYGFAQAGNIRFYTDPPQSLGAPA